MDKTAFLEYTPHYTKTGMSILLENVIDCPLYRIIKGGYVVKRSKGCNLVNLLLLICMLLSCLQIPMPVRSAEPEQTDGIISTELLHEHGGSDCDCYEDVFYECGGKVSLLEIRDNVPWYKCDRCNGISIGVYPGEYHSGYYLRTLSCSESSIGIFLVEKFSDGKNVSLIAGLAAKSEIIDEYSFEWDEEGAYDMGGSSVLPIHSRGTFSVKLKYHDARADRWCESVLSYTDHSVPVHVIYMDGDAVIEDKYLAYQSVPERVTPPQKKGYSFKGYYAEDERYHDEEGEPADRGLQALTGYELILKARWEGVKCRFYYGDDADGDNVPDSSAEFTYGEAPPDIDPGIPEERPGYIFDAYYIGDKKVYDAGGRPVGIWEELPGDDVLILEERWIANNYSLYYGDDTDGDGVPDREKILQYGDGLPELEVPDEREGYVFDGYFYGERQIYDRYGKVTDTLPELFEGEGCILESVWHRKSYLLRFGGDADDDGIPDESISIAYGDEIPDIDPAVPLSPLGYVFAGYEVNGIKVYDGERRPAGIWKPALDEGTYTLKALWEAMSFTLHYGADEDVDGLPDKSVTFKYGSIPPAIEIPDAKGHSGYVFEGYYLGNRKLYDSEGQPLGIWKTILNGDDDHILTEHWRGVKLILRYGADPDGDGIPNGRAEVVFGEKLPELGLGEPAARRGQIFKGYYVDDVLLYDSKGYPQGSWLFSAEEKEYILCGKWEMCRYTLRYGKDKDGDGIPDGSVEVEYGGEPPKLELEAPAPRKGYVFEGYYAGGKLIYDADGRPAGGWELDGQTSYILEEVWRAKTYQVRYGGDEDKDGIPDSAFTATYAKEYPDVEVPALGKGMVFDGYYLTDEMVFDNEGKAMGEWLWDVDKPMLELRSHREKNKDAYQAAPEENTEEPGGGEDTGEADAEEDGENSAGDTDEGDADAEAGSVSGNAAGRNIQKPANRKRAETEVQQTEEVTLKEPDEEEQEETKIIPQAEAETSESGKEEDLRQQAEPESKETAVSRSEAEAVKEERESSSVLPVIRKVAKAGAVTVGGIGCIIAVYAGLVYIFTMAEVDTVRPDGSRKRLCKLCIRSEKGKAFAIKLNTEIRERCETDKLCLKLPLLFAMRYKDHTILIQSRGKLQETRISREIYVTI